MCAGMPEALLHDDPQHLLLGHGRVIGQSDPGRKKAGLPPGQQIRAEHRFGHACKRVKKTGIVVGVTGLDEESGGDRLHCAIVVGNATPRTCAAEPGTARDRGHAGNE